jgi:hypothetical protein
MMATTAEKPGLMERMGRAVNATSLASKDGQIGNVEMVAALAFAQMNPSGDVHVARKDAEIEIDPGAYLGSLLIRIKAGRRPGSVPTKEAMVAVDNLVHWVRQQKYFSKWKLRDGHGMLRSFVMQGLAEWLTDTCPDCDGVEWTGLERDSVKAKRVKCRSCKGTGWGSRTKRSGPRSDGPPITLRIACPACSGYRSVLKEVVRPVRPKQCGSCRGTGRRLANDPERSRVLAVSMATYERHWIRRFEWLRDRLDALDKSEKNMLQTQLQRRINPDCR